MFCDMFTIFIVASNLVDKRGRKKTYLDHEKAALPAISRRNCGQGVFMVRVITLYRVKQKWVQSARLSRTLFVLHCFGFNKIDRLILCRRYKKW
jgi:hypothetical protein